MLNTILILYLHLPYARNDINDNKYLTLPVITI